MPRDFSQCSLINIDSSFAELNEHEVTAELIEAWVCSLSFKNFDFLEKRLPFVLDFRTNVATTWLKLIASAKWKYWVRDSGIGILVFATNSDCGYVRTYRFSSAFSAIQSTYLTSAWTQIKDEATLYEMLDTPTNRAVFDAWSEHKSKVTELPTEFVVGRHANTNIEKSIVFSQGEGCVVCGIKATAYAATTIGHTGAAVLAHIPVCQEHLESAKAHPTILHFLASIFNLSLDWDGLLKRDSIPDELIPIIHEAVAIELEGAVGDVDKRDRGWHLRIPLASGWHWLLRLNTLTDFAYMLFEPGKKTERYRADSAPDHPDVPFFPVHQHSRPGNKKKDVVTPSFLYGHPLLDLKRLKAAGREYGAC